MYRILRPIADSYVTNKIILGSRPGSTSSMDANTGMAGTLDLFKLYNETTLPSGSSGIELSRALIKFDLSEALPVTSSTNFKAYLKLSSVYGGQTVPSNFNLMVAPLAKGFSEGVGFDVVAYRDLDAVNWHTASIDGTNITTWTSGGCGYGGDSTSSSLDFITSLNSGSVNMVFSQSFETGKEDMFLEITPYVSAAIHNQIVDKGLRISFSGSEETDSVTRFVKRFSSRQSKNVSKHPALILKYEDSFVDNQADAYLDYPNIIGAYNNPFCAARNFVSGSNYAVGSGSVVLDMVASKSAYVTATTYSITHSASITYYSSSWTYFSQSFTGSQISFNGGTSFITGSYFADVRISSLASGLSNVANDDGSVNFIPVWRHPLTASFVYATGSAITLRPANQANQAFGSTSRNVVVNITNLKPAYQSTDVVRLRVFFYDYDAELSAQYVKVPPRPKIYQNVSWSILDSNSQETIIPFDPVYTKLSADGAGMYFDVHMSDLPKDTPLAIKLQVQENATGGQWYAPQPGYMQFVFKVTAR